MINKKSRKSIQNTNKSNSNLNLITEMLGNMSKTQDLIKTNVNSNDSDIIEVIDISNISFSTIL